MAATDMTATAIDNSIQCTTRHDRGGMLISSGRFYRKRSGLCQRRRGCRGRFETELTERVPPDSAFQSQSIVYQQLQWPNRVLSAILCARCFGGTLKGHSSGWEEKKHMSARDELRRDTLPIPDRTHVGLTTYDAKDPDTNFPPI